MRLDIARFWFISVTAATVVSTPAWAGVVTWDGGGDGTTWHDPLNWSGNALPGAGDDVVIGAVAVSFSTSTTETVASLSCDGSLQITTGTLVVNGTSSVGELSISNGTWDGAGNLTITGPFTWTGGTMRGDGTTFADGGIVLSTVGIKQLRRALENSGTADWTGGQFRISDPGSFNNMPGALFDHQTDGTLLWDTTLPGVFDNQGTFRKSAGAGNTELRVPFDNSGSVDIQSGTVYFTQDTVHSGTIAGAGTVRFHSGTHMLEASSSVTCAVNCTAGTTTILGSVDVPSLTIGSATVDVAAPAVDTVSYEQTNGTLTGTGDVVVSGPATWSGGTMSGDGTFFPNGGIVLSTVGIKQLRRALENSGTADWTGGQFRISDPGVFLNMPGALFDHQTDGTLLWDTTLPGVFDNQGTFRKSAGAGNTELRVPFDNSGSVDIQSGTVYFTQDTVHSGTIAGAGTVRFHSGTHMLEASSSVTCAVNCTAGTTTILGSVDVPSLTIGSATVDVAAPAVDTVSYEQTNGTLTGTGDVVVSGPATWSGGTMSGDGTFFPNGGIVLSTVGIKQLRRALENSGTADWTGGQFRISDPGVFLNMPGALFDHQTDGTLLWDTTLPGDFDNQGTFRKSAGDGTTGVRVHLTNSGIVEVLSGKVLIREEYTQTDGVTHVETELEFEAGDQLDLLGGVLRGDGLVDGFVNNDGGTINPGLSPGQLDVEGDVDMSVLARFTVELGGRNAGEYDVLAVDGDAMLGGLLDIRRFNGYQPAVGTVFTVLTTTGDRIDTFDETFCDAFFDIRYLAQAVELEVIAELPIADLNQDCSVGFADLSILLGTWGPCPKGEFCAADFDLSGSVGFNDLSFLLGNWG